MDRKSQGFSSFRSQTDVHTHFISYLLAVLHLDIIVIDLPELVVSPMLLDDCLTIRKPLYKTSFKLFIVTFLICTPFSGPNVVIGWFRDAGLWPDVVEFLLRLRPVFRPSNFARLFLFPFLFFPIPSAPALLSLISLSFSFLLLCESCACGMEGWP